MANLIKRLINKLMPTITKVVVTYSDGSTQELDAPKVFTQNIILAPGESAQINAQ